jgi:DNA repair protein RadC
LTNSDQLVEEVLAGLAQAPHFLAAQEASKDYVERNTGATQHVMNYLEATNWLQQQLQPEELEELG